MSTIKILMITAYFPYPLNAGGRIRQYHLLKRLSAKHDISLVSFIDSLEERKYVSAVSPFCTRIKTVPREHRILAPSSRTRDRLARTGQLLQSALSHEPPSLIRSFVSSEMKSQIAKLLKEDDFDLLQIDYTQMASYLPENCDIPSVLVEEDVMFSKAIRGFRAAESPLLKAQRFVDSIKTKNFELEACRKYQKVVTMSESDRQILLNHLPDLNASVIPNGVDTTFYKRPLEHRRRSSENIVFIGGMANTPNLDAVNYFYGRIYPSIRRRMPNAKLWIIGPDGPEALPNLHDDKSVVVTGYVDDIRPHLYDCAVCVAPLRITGGTSLKILEAMSSSCAVITTSLGAEGLDVTHGEDILIADATLDFADAVIEAACNPTLQQQLGDAARALIEREYDWDSIAEKNSNLYLEMVTKNRGSSVEPQASPISC